MGMVAGLGLMGLSHGVEMFWESAMRVMEKRNSVHGRTFALNLNWNLCLK